MRSDVMHPDTLSAETLDDLLAEQAAQQQVLRLALRCIAELMRSTGQDPEDLCDWWKADGHDALDEATRRLAPERDASWRRRAKARLDAILDEGLR